MENVVQSRIRIVPDPVSLRAETHATRKARSARRVSLLDRELADLRRENDDLRRNLFEAAHVQRRLCGPRVLHRDSFEIASEIFPVRHLSGDFICLFEVEDRLVFAVGDIAGKGLPAGMWFTHVISTIRLQFATHKDPAAAVARMNRGLLHAQLELPLTSLFVGVLNTGTGDLTYCNAGHPPAIVLHENGEHAFLSEGGPLLGVLVDASFTCGHTVLLPSDTLLAYSDGIPECRDAAGVEFGTERLLQALQSLPASPPSAVLFSLLATVEDFAAGRSREDDIGLLVMQREMQ